MKRARVMMTEVTHSDAFTIQIQSKWSARAIIIGTRTHFVLLDFIILLSQIHISRVLFIMIEYRNNIS